jgi:hypothetical protein
MRRYYIRSFSGVSAVSLGTCQARVQSWLERQPCIRLPVAHSKYRKRYVLRETTLRTLKVRETQILKRKCSAWAKIKAGLILLFCYTWLMSHCSQRDTDRHKRSSDWVGPPPICPIGKLSGQWSLEDCATCHFEPQLLIEPRLENNISKCDDMNREGDYSCRRLQIEVSIVGPCLPND